MTPSVSSKGTPNASVENKGLAERTISGCTAGCTSEPGTANADPLAALASALLGLSATDRARLAALLVNPDDFASRFAAAFDRLDAARGGHNFVSLVDLRAALADVSREAFDAGLNRLRAASAFTLSAAEGRHGITPAERDAALREDGCLLLFASRRR